MHSKVDASPLHRFALVDTRDLDQMQGAVSGVFGEVMLDTPASQAGFRAVANFCRLRDSGIYFGHYSAPLRVTSAHTSFIAQGVTLGGFGSNLFNGVEQQLNENALPAPVNCSGRLDVTFGPSHRHLAFSMDPRALRRKLSAVIDAPVSRELLVEKPAGYSHPDAQLFRRLLFFVIDELDRRDSPASPLVLAELEQSLMVAFLSSHQHNFSRHLSTSPRPMAAWQVRRAEEYIEANWDKPLTVEVLADAINASVRSVFHTFKATRGYSPTSFLKRVRLQHARMILSDPGASHSVTDVAYRCGFGNLGHFAKYYFREFNELPSETLKKARAAGGHPPFHVREDGHDAMPLQDRIGAR